MQQPSPSSPLAERLRPHTFNDFVGQSHLSSDDGFIQQLLREGGLVSLILWGPPGSGKTTLARIIARETKADFIEISAVTAKLADVRKIIERAEANQRLQQPTILFVDEIHRFNKAQQDAFLPHVENGLITLIGATTENPSFEVIRPLLSRSRVLTLQPLQAQDLKAIINRAAETLGIAERLDAEAVDCLVQLSAGDARRAINTLEISVQLTNNDIDVKTMQMAAQQYVPGFDKQGEMHYDLISAFIKSMRGSDSDATLYYLARMLASGEDGKFIARRMVVFASEDIGVADNNCMDLAVATFQAVDMVGLPEASYNLFHCASVLAQAPKSRAVSHAKDRAQALARDYPEAPVPLHLRNAPTELMQELGYGAGYHWEADFQPSDGFLPEELADQSVWGEEQGGNT